MATKRAGGAKGVKKETVKPLITQARIQKRIREMGRQIRKDFPDEPILLLGVLKGRCRSWRTWRDRFREK